MKQFTLMGEWEEINKFLFLNFPVLTWRYIFQECPFWCVFHLIVCPEEWARILISICMWWNYWILGNESSKRILENRTQSPHRDGNSDYSHKLDWKTLLLYGHWLEYAKGSCLSIWSNQTLIQRCLGNLKCKNQKDQTVSKDLYWIPEQTSRISIGKQKCPPLNKWNWKRLVSNQVVQVCKKQENTGA